MAKPDIQNDMFESLLDRLTEAVALRLKQSGRLPGSGAAAPAKRKRHFSPEALARISAAAKKRWAKYRKEV